MENSKDLTKKKLWEWHSNIYDLKTIENDVAQIWNCSPYVMICSSSSGDEDPDLTINLEMNKEFKWANDGSGWHWHKSWNLPSFKISVTVRQPVMQS